MSDGGGAKYDGMMMEELQQELQDRNLETEVGWSTARFAVHCQGTRHQFIAHRPTTMKVSGTCTCVGLRRFACCARLLPWSASRLPHAVLMFPADPSHARMAQRSRAVGLKQRVVVFLQHCAAG
jgi:hypothetical protein